jgi:hypothetical protein
MTFHAKEATLFPPSPSSIRKRSLGISHDPFIHKRLLPRRIQLLFTIAKDCTRIDNDKEDTSFRVAFANSFQLDEIEEKKFKFPLVQRFLL